VNESPRRILWTGGFDSTWLVVDALLDGYRVEAPVWRGVGVGIGSWQKPANEDEARRRILHALPPDLQSRLRSVAIDGRMTGAWQDAWAELTAAEGDRWWPPQTYMIASLPQLTGPVEAAFVATDVTTSRPGIMAALERRGVRSPIADLTKPELLVDATRRGFRHLLDLTWSCECDIAGAGDCDPCHHRVIPGLASGIRVA